MLPPSPSAHRSRKIGFSFDDIENEGAPVEPLEVEAKCDNAANHRAWMAGAMVSALAFVLLGVTIALDEHASEPPSGERDLSSPVGWVGLFSAVLLFGSVGVMVKIPSVMEADVDPMSFQIYQSAGIVFVSLVVLLYEIFQEHGHTSSLKLSWWGVMGAAIIYVAQAFAYNGVRGLGNAVGPATWAGIGMCVSFTWGVGLYREGVGSVGECIAALAVLVSGIFGVALSPTTLPQQILACLNGGKPNVTTNTPLASRDGRDESVATILASVPDVTANEDKKAEEAPTISRRQGLMCALMVGLVDGSLMVPYKAFLKAEDENDITSAAATLRSAANATRGLSVDTVARLLRHSPTGNGTSASTSRGVSLENSYVISLGKITTPTHPRCHFSYRLHVQV